MLKLTLVFAELERETIGERTKTKAKWRAEQGLWNGNQILGFDLEPDNPGHLIVNKEEAELVKLLFDTYLKVKSVKETARILNAKGYRSKSYVSKKGHKRGGIKFSGATIAKIIQNPVYIGKIRFKGEVYEGQHEAIVTIPTYEAIQTRLDKVRPLERPARRKKRQYPFYLGGLIRCGYCGSFMTPLYALGRGKKKYFYYECTKRRHNGKGSEEEGSCDMPAVPAREMDDLILKQIKHIAMDKEMLEEALAQASETDSKEVKKLHKEKEKLEGMYKEAESRKDRFMKMVGNGIFENADEEEKVEMHKEFKKAMADMKEIEANIMNIEFQLADEETRVFNAEIMHETLYRFTSVFG